MRIHGWRWCTKKVNNVRYLNQVPVSIRQNRISKTHLLDCGHSKTMDFTASIHLVCLWKMLIVRSMNDKWLAAHRMLVHIIRQEKKRWATFVRNEFRRSRFNDWIHPELFSWVFRTSCSSHGFLQTHWILNAFSNYNNYTFNRNDSFVVYICSGCGSLDGAYMSLPSFTKHLHFPFYPPILSSSAASQRFRLQLLLKLVSITFLLKFTHGILMTALSKREWTAF